MLTRTQCRSAVDSGLVIDPTRRWYHHQAPTQFVPLTPRQVAGAAAALVVLEG